MSKNNFVRARLKNETDRKAYHNKVITGNDPYYCCDCCANYHNYRKNRMYNGNTRKKIERWKYRMYRTWKYNRVNQYKE